MRHQFSFQRQRKEVSLAVIPHDSDASELFADLSSNPFKEIEMESRCFKILERLTVMLYDKNSKSKEEWVCFAPRVDLITNFLQHKTRSASMSKVHCIKLEHGQYRINLGKIFKRLTHLDGSSSKGIWQLVWVTIPQVSSACHELHCTRFCLYIDIKVHVK